MNTDIHLHLQNEFWTNSSEPEKDRETISKLYIEGLLNVASPARTFWDCFHNSYNANSKGIDGKTRILSIIAEKFTYKEIIEELGVCKIFDTVYYKNMCK